MNARELWFLPVLALVAIGVSLWTGDPALAAGSAGVGGLLAGLYLLAVLYPLVRWDLPPLPTFDADPLLLLAKAFRSGRFGRAAILARLHGLQPIGSVDLAQQLAEEQRLLDAPEAEFLRYLDQRLAEVERAT